MSNKNYSDFDVYLQNKNNKDYFMFCDNDTYEVVYLNEAICKHLDINLENSINKKCYNVIYGRETPCPYCVSHELNQGIFNSVDVKYPLKGEKYDCCVSLIQYNGKTIRVNRYFNDNLNKKSEIITDAIKNNLITNIENGDFVIYFQPKFCIENTLIGVEAFVRKINRDDNTIIMPIDFLPLYENENLISNLDLEILRLVCETQSNWIKLGKNIKIDVNMSVLTLTKENIVDDIKNICNKYKVPYNLICIGLIDDENLTKYMNAIQMNITELSTYGFSFAIDSFDLEHYNITNLIKIDFSEIKFCKLLLKDIKNNEKKQVIVKNIIEMCSQMPSTTTLALGIETKEQEEFIKKLAPTYVQGYFYSQPLTEKEFYDTYL